MPQDSVRRAAHAPGGNDDVCVVMPVFNEERVVGDVVRDVRRRFARVVCVDDGSTDGSAARASRAGAAVVRHPVNLGQGAALQTGIAYALRLPSVAYVVTFDADGQHRVEDALRMVEAARAGDVDVVLGSRFLSPTPVIPPVRRLLLRAAAAYTRLSTGLAVTDAHNGLRVLNRRAAASVDIRLHGMAHASELLAQVAQAGLRYREVPVSVLYTDYSRQKGQPGVNAVNILFDLWVDRLRVAR